MTTPGTPDGPLRIVIADDQASVREGLVLLLGGLPGIEVVGAAADGEQAIALVAEHHPDAILLDLHMPVLDGIGATRRLTAEQQDQALTHAGLVVGDDDAQWAIGCAGGGHGVPLPGWARGSSAVTIHWLSLGPACSVPFSSRSRSRIPVRP